MPELNIERSDFATCIMKDRYLFALFGYNEPKKEMLNTIEYLDLNEENGEWKYLKYNNLDLIGCYIKGSISVNHQDKKIILVGGINEANEPLKTFIQIIFPDSENITDAYVENVDRNFKDIAKNDVYTFSTGFTKFIDNENREFNVAFDNTNNIHVFEVKNMAHDVFYMP